MAREGFPKSRILTVRRLMNQIQESNKRGERFCFILGSGASKESGIPTGMELEMRWMNCIMGVAEDYGTPAKDPEDMRETAATLLDDKVMKHSFETLEQAWQQARDKGWNTLSPDYYSDLYALRFYPDPDNGYDYMDQRMEHCIPSMGYRLLALLMEENNYQNNLVITTNFDSLLEDALFFYGKKKPLSVGHEALADFISANIRRPIIAKVHRGMLLRPFNTPEETDHLSDAWKTALNAALQNYTPIVIGYGGGDESLMSFLETEAPLKKIYWCYRHVKAEDWVEERPEKLLRRNRNGYLVEIGGFDALMLALGGQRFAEQATPTKTVERLNEVCGKWAEKYQNQYNALSETAETKKTSAPVRRAEERQAEERTNAGKRDKWDYIREAYEAYESGDYEKAIELLNELIEREPEFADAYNNRGVAKYNMGEYQKAIDDYNEALRLNPDYAKAYYNRGIVWDDLGEYQKAIDDYNEALRLNPDYAEAYNNRGNALRELGEYQKAIDDYNEVLRLKPDDAKPYNNRGYAWGRRGEHQKAIDDFNEALRLNPDDAEAYINRGVAWGNLGEHQKAIDDFNEAIRLNPDYAKAYNSRGVAWNDLGKYQKAIDDYNEALRLNPDDADAYNNRGVAWDNLGEYQKAMADCNEALRLKPDLAEAYDSRGNVWLHLGEHQKAIDDFSEAIRLNPKFKPSYENRAKAYRAIGRDDLAQQDEDTAAKL